jgi:ubiquinone/menaquinone biosynthesis C-methylase UbiE
LAERDIVEEMNTYYAKRALWHDTYMGYTSNDAMENLLGPIIRWVEAYVAGRNVLEVACGTGNWTQVLSKRARSVLATDINTSVLEIAGTKPYEKDNVRLEIADAYELAGIDGTFDAAFAADWYSHIPKSRIARFVEGLLGRLSPGANVVLVDMLPRPELERMFSHYDDEGNRISRRPLPTGEVFEVVRNFPSEKELDHVFGCVAEGMDYREHAGLRRWMLAFAVR